MKKIYALIPAIIISFCVNVFPDKINPLIPQDTVVIQYLSQNQKVTGAVIYKNDLIKYYAIPDNDNRSADLIDKWIDLFGEKDITGISSELFNILIKPIENELRNQKSIVFIPSGNLFSIPFSALYDSAKKHYLIETYKISYINNIEMMVKPSLFTNQDISVYLFGNAVYNTKNKASSSRGVKIENKKDYKNELSYSDFSWPNLPGTKTEIDKIALIIKKYKQYNGCHVFEEKEASETTLMKLIESIKPETNNIVHLAAHGYYNEFKPSNSAIVLALNGSGENDGYFSINEIINLDLKNIVFVLSACETARGKIITGEGIFNIPKFLLLSGSNNVVATLFTVNDEATSEFMETFYQAISIEKDIVSALRYAQLSFINQKGKKSDPYYWASFMVYGK